MIFERMHIYTVHIKPGADIERQKPVFVKEGFNILAFVFSLPWALYQRLWGVALVVGGFDALMVYMARGHMLSESSVMVLHLGSEALMGLLGNDFVRARLKRQGYIFADISAADGKLRAEQRYFERYLAQA